MTRKDRERKLEQAHVHTRRGDVRRDADSKALTADQRRCVAQEARREARRAGVVVLLPELRELPPKQIMPSQMPKPKPKRERTVVRSRPRLYFGTDNPAHEKRPLTERPMKLEPRARESLRGKKSKRVRRNAWVPR